MAALPLLLFAAQGLLQLSNSRLEAEAIRNNAEISNRVGQLNAQFAELDAFEAESFGQTQAARYQSIPDSIISAQKTAFEASGIDPTFGTAREIIDDTRLVARLNTLEIQKQARERSRGFKRQARNFRLQGVLGNLQADITAEARERQGITDIIRTGISGYIATR